MTVKAEKFQTIILNKKESEAQYKLTVGNNDIHDAKSLELIDLTTDSHLKCDQQISNMQC